MFRQCRGVTRKTTTRPAEGSGPTDNVIEEGASQAAEGLTRKDAATKEATKITFLRDPRLKCNTIRSHMFYI